MSLLVAAAVAAGAGILGAAIGVRIWWRRRSQSSSRVTEGAAPRSAIAPASHHPHAEERPARSAELWLGLGDVVQLADESLWLSSGALVREGGSIRAGLWWPGPDRSGALVLELPAPERRVYRLEQRPAELPPGSPSRLELDGTLFDRRRSLPVRIEWQAGAPTPLGEQALFSLYTAASGEVALVLQSSHGNIVASGRAFELAEIDRLGYADPATEAGEPLQLEPIDPPARRATSAPAG